MLAEDDMNRFSFEKTSLFYGTLYQRQADHQTAKTSKTRGNGAMITIAGEPNALVFNICIFFMIVESCWFECFSKIGILFLTFLYR